MPSRTSASNFRNHEVNPFALNLSKGGFSGSLLLHHPPFMVRTINGAILSQWRAPSMFLAVDARPHEDGDVAPAEQREAGEPARRRKLDPVRVGGRMYLRRDQAQREGQHHEPQAQLVERIEDHLP